MNGESESRAKASLNPKLIAVVLIAVLAVLAAFALFSRGGALVNRGQLVGVATSEGTIYFGELVLADSKSVVLRNTYTSAGYLSLPVESGATGPAPAPTYQVAPAAGSAGAGGVTPAGLGVEESTLVVPRSHVLFMSTDVAGFAAKAIQNWKPTPSPTPVPTPKLTPTPVGEKAEEKPKATVEPTPAPTETPTPTPVPTPARFPRVTPGEGE